MRFCGRRFIFTKKGITMKNLTLATRAVYAAFVRVLCAIPASFLNLKGGGGGRNSPHRSARLRGHFRGLFCVAV